MDGGAVAPISKLEPFVALSKLHLQGFTAKIGTFLVVEAGICKIKEKDT
jgi:hypothetical protein